MVAASVFGLIIPGTETGSLAAVIGGISVGGFGLLLGNRIVPTSTPNTVAGGATAGRERRPSDGAPLRRALLIGGAITLHNAPEGLAMGIGFASGLEAVAAVLAVVIGLQNVPGGFAFAVPVSQSGVSTPSVVLYTTLSGAVPQVLASVFGFGLVAVAQGVFPIAAGFAAGAMLAAVLREMVPMSHGLRRRGHSRVRFARRRRSYHRLTRPGARR